MNFVKSNDIKKVLIEELSIFLLDKYGNEISMDNIEGNYIDKGNENDYDITIEFIVEDNEIFKDIKFVCFNGVDHWNTYSGDTMVYELK